MTYFTEASVCKEGAPAQRGYALPGNAEFVALLDAYRETGGLAHAREVSSMRASRHGPGGRMLVSWMSDRELLRFEWQSQIWIPLFQFDRATMALHEGLIEILMILSRSLQPWQQAMWFAQPNGWLGEKIPAKVFTHDLAAVAHAAHADQHLGAPAHIRSH